MDVRSVILKSALGKPGKFSSNILTKIVLSMSLEMLENKLFTKCFPFTAKVIPGTTEPSLFIASIISSSWRQLKVQREY